MDRRTILFAIAIFCALFLFKTYDDWQYSEKLQQWNLSQQAKKKQQIKILETEIVEKTALPENLPITVAYFDKEGKQPAAKGVFTDKSFLTTSWNDSPPSVIYVHSTKDSNSLNELKLSYKAAGLNTPLLYQENPKSPLTIAQLPDLGSYQLQAIDLNQQNPEASQPVMLAEYRDGYITIINQQVDKLKNEIVGPEGSKSSVPDQPRNLLLLFKSDEAYLPIAFYNTGTKNTLFLEDIEGLQIQSTDNKDQSANLSKLKGDQKYFVIENDYQQLVFTNVGGALVEINLPFSSEENKVSAVRAIEFDREMVEDHPYNAYFPANPFLTPGSSPAGPYIEHNKGKLGGYYPLIRRDLIETGKWQSVKLNPKYYAFNLLSEYPEFAELVYTVKHFDNHSITFEGQQRQRRITKTFSIPKDKDAPYSFDLTIKIEGDKRSLWLSSGVPEVELFSGSPAPVLKYRITRNQTPYVESINLPDGATTNSSISPDWFCNSNGFFGIIIDPITPIDPGFKVVNVPGQNVPSRLIEIDQDYDRYAAKDMPGYLLMAPLSTTSNTMNFRIFAGPFSSSVLKAVDSVYADPAIGYNPDYIACQSYHGWFSFISEPFAKLLFMLMSFFHSITGSWALSIVLLTVALRIMMYPLNAWSTRSMLRMQQVAPMVAALQEKYKKDPKKLQLEMVNLYRDQKVNPVSGCVPMLIQMPFLIGMFDLLKSTFELRGASFIPGWIDNLTAPDVLFSWETPIYFIGNQFHLLPILLGVVMFLQQKMSAPSIPVEEMTDQQRQQKAMGTIMPVIFTFMFWNFPSGLNIYWLSSMLLAMLQQWWMQRNLKPITPVVVETVPAKQRKP